MTPGSLDFKTKLSFEGLPDMAWSTEAVQGVLKEINGDLIEFIPPENWHKLKVMAWLRDPSTAGKVLKVEIPEPKVALCTDLSESFDDLDTPSYGPSSPRSKRPLVYPVLVHVKEVVDRGPLLVEDLSDEWLPRERVALTRTHKFTTSLAGWMALACLVHQFEVNC